MKSPLQIKIQNYLKELNDPVEYEVFHSLMTIYRSHWVPGAPVPRDEKGNALNYLDAKDELVKMIDKKQHFTKREMEEINMFDHIFYNYIVNALFDLNIYKTSAASYDGRKDFE